MAITLDSFGTPQLMQPKVGLDPGPQMPDLGSRAKGWLEYIEDFLANKDNAMPLLNAGLTMLQPTPAGGNAWTNVLGGVNAFVGTQQAQEAKDEKKQDRALRERLANAQVASLEAGTEGTRAQTNRVNRMTPIEESLGLANIEGTQARTEATRTGTRLAENADRRADTQLRLDADFKNRQLGLGFSELQARIDANRIADENADADREVTRRGQDFQREVGLKNASRQSGQGQFGLLVDDFDTLIRRQDPNASPEDSYVRAVRAAQVAVGKSRSELEADLYRSGQFDPKDEGDVAIVNRILEQADVNNILYPEGKPTPPTSAGGSNAGAKPWANHPSYRAKLAEIANNRTLTPAEKAAKVAELDRLGAAAFGGGR